MTLAFQSSKAKGPPSFPLVCLPPGVIRSKEWILVVSSILYSFRCAALGARYHLNFSCIHRVIIPCIHVLIRLLVVI
jgi:hypothetical protein